MGLGKTVQTVAFLLAIMGRQKNSEGSPVMIVAPSSLLTNWEREIKAWGSLGNRNFTIVKYSGNSRDSMYP